MININNLLRDLYISTLPDLAKMYSTLDSAGITDYVGPLLLYCWEEDYLNSKHKLLIIGQETNGWKDDYIKTSSDIDDSIEYYRRFQLGTEYNSLFWRYAHEINQMINETDNLNFVWNNINKFGVDGKGRPEKIVLEEENKHYNIFQKEIEILSPDVCIFLTGPNYDADLQQKFPNISYLEFADYPIRKVSQLSSNFLPTHSYRLYHPGYGNRYSEWYYKILDSIVKKINGV